MPLTEPTWDVVTSMKAVLWEEAKGKLRAMVALQGSFSDATLASEPRSPAGRRHDELLDEVTAFIARVEDRALQE